MRIFQPHASESGRAVILLENWAKEEIGAFAGQVLRVMVLGIDRARVARQPNGLDLLCKGPDRLGPERQIMPSRNA